jgi:hypothetical protein
MNALRQAEYERLRLRLQSLLAQSNRNLIEVDSLVGDLDRLQLAIKAELGIRGNNPNE